MGKLEIYIWCKKFFLNDLILILFSAAVDFFSENYSLVKTTR